MNKQEKVVALLRENPEITAKEIAEMALLSLRTIKSILADLTKDNIIEREGTNRKGIWIVKQQVDL